MSRPGPRAGASVPRGRSVRTQEGKCPGPGGRLRAPTAGGDRSRPRAGLRSGRCAPNPDPVGRQDCETQHVATGSLAFHVPVMVDGSDVCSLRQAHCEQRGEPDGRQCDADGCGGPPNICVRPRTAQHKVLSGTSDQPAQGCAACSVGHPGADRNLPWRGGQGAVAGGRPGEPAPAGAVAHEDGCARRDPRVSDAQASDRTESSGTGHSAAGGCVRGVPSPHPLPPTEPRTMRTRPRSR